VPHYRRAVSRSQGTARRILGHQGARSRCCTGLGSSGDGRLQGSGRGSSVARRARELKGPMGEPVDAAQIGRVFRNESGRAVASLVRFFGDIDIAEEAVQDAFEIALKRWATDGLPPSPAGWIITTARNRAIDRIR